MSSGITASMKASSESYPNVASMPRVSSGLGPMWRVTQRTGGGGGGRAGPINGGGGAPQEKGGGSPRAPPPAPGRPPPPGVYYSAAGLIHPPGVLFNGS